MDALSKWFLKNEEQLYKEVLIQVNELTTSFPGEGGRTIVFKEDDPNTLLGQLTHKITDGKNKIGVFFKYNDIETPKSSLYLTAFYNKEYIETIDALFTGLANPQYFSITKYSQPSPPVGVMAFYSKNRLEGKVNGRNIRAIIENTAPPYELTFLIKHRNPEFIEKIHEQLFQGILGEQLYLTKVKHISYQVTSTIDKSLLTLKKLFEELSS